MVKNLPADAGDGSQEGRGLILGMGCILGRHGLRN